MEFLKDVLDVFVTVTLSLLIFTLLVITDLIIIPIIFFVTVVGGLIHHTCYDFVYTAIPAWWSATLEALRKVGEDK